jgi:hypothetical protein
MTGVPRGLRLTDAERWSNPLKTLANRWYVIILHHKDFSDDVISFSMSPGERPSMAEIADVITDLIELPPQNSPKEKKKRRARRNRGSGSGGVGASVSTLYISGSDPNLNQSQDPFSKSLSKSRTEQLSRSLLSGSGNSSMRASVSGSMKVSGHGSMRNSGSHSNMTGFTHSHDDLSLHPLGPSSDPSSFDSGSADLLEPTHSSDYYEAYEESESDGEGEEVTGSYDHDSSEDRSLPAYDHEETSESSRDHPLVPLHDPMESIAHD